MTSELRGIRDEHKKRFIKFKIQSLLYESMCTPRVPGPAFSPEPYGIYSSHPQWESSCGSTPTESWNSSPGYYNPNLAAFGDGESHDEQ